jgi:hypothetical protein
LYLGKQLVLRTKARTRAALAFEEMREWRESRVVLRRIRVARCLGQVRRKWGTVVEVRIESNVARTQLAEDAALQVTQVCVHLLQSLGGSGIVEGRDLHVAR